MADSTDIILKQIEQQWSQARQSEIQRASITQYILILVTAIQGFIVQLKFAPPSLALAILMTILGCYGAIISAKYYERFRLGVCRVGRLMEWMEAHHADITLTELEKAADAKHLLRHPTMSKIRLHTLWQSLHWCIACGGVINAIVICAKWSF